jgi:DNA-binding IclR family transcriptional regulator
VDGFRSECDQALYALDAGAIETCDCPSQSIYNACAATVAEVEWIIMPAVRKKKIVVGKSGAMTSTLRCFQVLELLAEAPFELSVSDIAELLSMPRASAHRLCKTLVEGGFIEPVPGSKRYSLTPKSLWVGSGYLRHSKIYRAAFFPMQSLAKQIPGTVQLGVLSEGKVLFIHSVGYPGSTEAFADVGLKRALHATASGKLFLTQMPLDKVEQLMAQGVEKYTERTTVSFVGLREELKQIASKGFAVNDEELLPGYLALAAPVYDSSGGLVGTISITVASDHTHAGYNSPHAASLCESARMTSLQLGFHPLMHTAQTRRARLRP